MKLRKKIKHSLFINPYIISKPKKTLFPTENLQLSLKATEVCSPELMVE
jgi:hypothetical protein